MVTFSRFKRSLKIQIRYSPLKENEKLYFDRKLAIECKNCVKVSLIKWKTACLDDVKLKPAQRNSRHWMCSAQKNSSRSLSLSLFLSLSLSLSLSFSLFLSLSLCPESSQVLALLSKGMPKLAFCKIYESGPKGSGGSLRVIR